MSRIKEALVFKTDEERLEWFHSLTPDEQADVATEAKELVEKTIEVFRPVAEALAKVFVLWFDLLYENISEIGAAFAMAQANNACTGQLAGAGEADCESTPTISSR
jgi:hypothetical protein